MPKFEFTYFAERLQKIGNDKAMKAFMCRLRKHYKGDDVLPEFADLNQTNVDKPATGEEQKNMFEYINTSTNNNNYLDEDPYGNYDAKNQYKTANTEQKPFFKLMDPTTSY